ncbi:PHP domain-containing protein [Motilibacter aurantiacus]|uniref:PHP domain-containing protein n=1 Tax=Motilibacter aurantiacus TaxID=2714955 RepID=UPI00140C33CE|nr:PHP domain-containing protein [Motilibacter aurantiacus]NHC43792.1 PHP domain-containing protein [Motilibacter aurantiacus]
MGHTHGHDHHHHDHAHPTGSEVPEAVDTSVPDSELSPRDLSRRKLLRNAGLLGAGAGAMSVFGPGVGAAAAASGGDVAPVADDEVVYLAGDHHIHTQFSSDAMYRVEDQARRAAEYGLDWMVVTDHGSVTHARIGVDKVNPEIVAAREANPRQLIFQGLEWNIPAAEHGTVFVAPGPNEVAVLKQFESDFDGSVSPAPRNEALAIAGINWMAQQKAAGRVEDAIMFANHPARQGIDSPHEIRGWRDASPGTFVGFEGAPGHQAATLQRPNAGARGLYGGAPRADSFPGYPLESYRTHGGFDWMTATVGGLWDSLLAEGRPWWITANSDSHSVFEDRLVRGSFAPGETFETLGHYPDPVDSGEPQRNRADFWPGYYSRTHVGVSKYGYLDVMAGLRAGNVWVDHGHLIDGIDAKLRLRGSVQRSATLGSTLTVPRGSRVDLEVTIDLATRPNLAGELPRLRRVDAIAGTVTGPVADRDTFTTNNTRVVEQFEISQASGRVFLSMRFRPVEQPFYVRLRGTDANRTAVGLRGAAIDPVGPAQDVPGVGSPWEDLWFYTNPIFVNVT